MVEKTNINVTLEHIPERCANYLASVVNLSYGRAKHFYK